MLSIERHIVRFRCCLAALAGLLVQACSNENFVPIPDEEPEEYVTMEFTMLTRNAGSASVVRSGDVPIPPNPEVGFAAENFLDLDNLTFLLFDDERKMLRTFTPEISVIDDASSPYIKYRVRAFLHDKYFLESVDDNITFTIVAVGNYSDLSPEDVSYHIGQNLEDIFDYAKVGTFAFPVSNNSVDTWIPTIAPVSGQGKGHIPMSGMQTFTVRTERLRTSSPDNPYNLSDGSSARYINMLRALAKIEIVDKIIPVDPENGDLTIEKVELVGYTTRGSLFPAFNQWSDNLETEYVTLPSVPLSAEYRGYGSLSETGVDAPAPDCFINFFHDSETTAARGDGGDVFSCYLTEYDTGRTGGIPGMWMRVTMKSLRTGKKFRMRLEAAPYTDGIAGAPMHILRNNIYRYVITGANDISMDIQPFANQNLSFGFGLMRDSRGDLMILPEKDGTYPEYFETFLLEHGFPKAEDEAGNQNGDIIELIEGDYYSIVVGENEEMSQATLWVKDREGCHVLSNFGSDDNTQTCSARLVESFYNTNESEKFYKDKYGYRRVYHYTNHNSIVRHPVHDNLLFCCIENFEQANETRRYYEVESWEDASKTGWIITKSSDGTETGFQEITSDGILGNTIPLN